MQAHEARHEQTVPCEPCGPPHELIGETLSQCANQRYNYCAYLEFPVYSVSLSVTTFRKMRTFFERLEVTLPEELSFLYTNISPERLLACNHYPADELLRAT